MSYEIMQIFWHGQSCFQIIATPHHKNTGGGQTSILIDPFSEEIGLRLPKLEADILCVTHSHYDHNNVKAIFGKPFLIEGPGEYEIKGVYIQGIMAFHDDTQGNQRGENTIYTVEVEDLRLCHLGDFGQKELTNEQLEEIGGVDILMIPVGGFSTISAKEALKIMAQIEPKITIPMHYYIPKLKQTKFDGVDKFLKALGVKSIVPLNKLSIKKKDLSSEEAKIIVLRP